MKRITQSNYTDTLSYLLNHYQMILQLNQLSCATLPASLHQHCYIANFRAHTIIIHVDSALWATRLRYSVPTLLKQWQAMLSSLTLEGIDIQVRPPITESTLLHPKLSLSKQTATLLCEVAGKVSHAKLKVALLKLATHCDQVD